MNPYLGFAAMLMAGLDGIQNKIHPGDAMDKNLYDLPPEELAAVPTVCGSLRQALDSLEASVLKAGGRVASPADDPTKIAPTVPADPAAAPPTAAAVPPTAAPPAAAAPTVALPAAEAATKKAP